MKISDLLEETYFAVTANKVRSSLTILGIVIGIGSVIAMIAIGQGAQNSVQSRIAAIGSNLLTVNPGMQRGPNTFISAGRGSARTLTGADAEAISTQITTALAVSPEVSSRYQIKTKGNNTNTSVIGCREQYLSAHNTQIASGSFFSQGQLDSRARVAVIGPTTRDDLFGENVDVIGQTITINNLPFVIIGLTVAKGGSGFNNPDDAVYVPITTAQQFLSGNTYLSSIAVQAPDQKSMSDIQTQITNLLLLRHKISDPTQADFNVINQADIASAASSVTGIFTILLASIAGISLLVGGIGIMNMMLTTVTERTREIGLRKAIGAQNTDISLQFLSEAVLLTFTGGAFGVLLGWILASLVTHFAAISTQVSMGSIILAFGVSAGIGIIFGYYPARRAASLNPIEALRYE